MIIAFSTSSPIAAVALFDMDGALRWHGEEEAGHRAGGACLGMLQRCQEETGVGVERARLFLADLGPGSFTGVRVGVTLAKTLAYCRGVPAGGATAFDLISTVDAVAIPSKRGEFYFREPGKQPARVSTLPETDVRGYGFGGQDERPSAAAFARLIDRIVPAAPEQLNPVYVAEPSISTPKKPYRSESDG